MIQLDKLVKRYGDITAVDNLTLTIEEGEIFGLLGPNGAGKTTTVNMAVGLLEPDSGRVNIGSLGSPTQAGVRKKIGVAPQALALYDDLTGRENAAFYGSLQGLDGQSLKDRVEWTLEFTGLKERGKDRVKTYSGGMKRRLNLAIALIHDPMLLFLDEPTVGVDPQSRNAIFDRIEILRSEGRTIVYTTHYMEEAERLCDRVGIIDNGRMLALDTVPALLEAHGGESIVTARRASGEIRKTTSEPLVELMRLQQEEPLLQFKVESPTMESVFLNLTGRTLRD